MTTRDLVAVMLAAVVWLCFLFTAWLYLRPFRPPARRTPRTPRTPRNITRSPLQRTRR